MKLAKDSIINALVTVTSGEDLRTKPALGHLSSPAIHKQIDIFKKIGLQQTVAQRAAYLDLSCLLSGPLIWASKKQLTNGVRSAERTLGNLPPTFGSYHPCKPRWPFYGQASSRVAEDQK